MKLDIVDYTILKMIEKEKYFSVYELRKTFNSLTGLSMAFSSFYRKVRILKESNMILIQPLRLTNEGKKQLVEMEKKLLEILTFLSCGLS